MTPQCVVLAGGLATRMLPLTQTTPKYLLNVAGRPFAEWQLARLRESGFSRFLIAIGHLGEPIRRALGDGQAHGVSIAYVDEGARALGTGGALALAAEEGLLDDTFLVTYGDSYLPFDCASPLERLRASPSLDGVMAVYENGGRFDTSNVALTADGRHVLRYEKGSHDPSLRHIDYGATALRVGVVQRAVERFGLDEVQRDLAARGTLGAVIASERFFEIGSPQGVVDLERYLG